MSIFTSIFGGSSQVKGAQPYIDAISDFDPTMYGGLGIGKPARDARKDLTAMRSGADIGTIAGLAPTINAVKSTYAANSDAAKRQIAADPTMFTEHPELVGAKQSEYQRGSDRDQGVAIGQATSDFYNNQQRFFQQAYSDAMARRQNAAGLKLNALQGAANAYTGSFRNQPGILSGVAGAVGAATGTGGIAGLFK